MNGYIALNRQIMDWEWWGDIVVSRLWITILLLANWQDKKWRGQIVKRGSFVTSYSTLANASGLSVQQVRTSIKKLESTGEITRIVTNKYQLITVEKYEKYQSELEEVNSQITDNQQSNNNQITINQQQLNKDNKGNKGNKEIKREKFSPPSLSDVEAYIAEKGYHINAESFIDFYSSKGWMVGSNKMKDWKAAVRTWERRRNSERMGEVHNRATDEDRRGMAGTADKSGTGNGSCGVFFPEVVFGFQEDE